MKCSVSVNDIENLLEKSRQAKALENSADVKVGSNLVDTLTSNSPALMTPNESGIISVLSFVCITPNESGMLSDLITPNESGVLSVLYLLSSHLTNEVYCFECCVFSLILLNHIFYTRNV